MTEQQVISWIFLSIALASQTEPATMDHISSIADGINHAIPTSWELETSISWLTKKNLIEARDEKYILTEKGKQEYEFVKGDSKLLFEIWKRLEERV